jgi:hypothetical protein
VTAAASQPSGLVEFFNGKHREFRDRRAARDHDRPCDLHDVGRIRHARFPNGHRRRARAGHWRECHFL